MKTQRHAGLALSSLLFLFISTVLADGTTGSPPTITGQPMSQTVPEGATVTFSVTASGTAPLNYYWSFNGANIPGATNSTLTLADVTASQAGNYSVFIINDYGATNSVYATLAVIPEIPPRFFDDFTGPGLNPIWQPNLPNAFNGSFPGPDMATNIGAPTYSFGLLDSNTVLDMDSVIGPLQRVGWSSSTNFLDDNFRYEARFNTLFLSSTSSVDGFFEIWIINATNSNLYDIVSPFAGNGGEFLYMFFGSSVDDFYSTSGQYPYAFSDNTWYRLVLQGLPGQDIRASLCDDNDNELIGYTFNHDASAFGSGFKIGISQSVGTSGQPFPTAVAVDYVSLTNQFSPGIVHQPQNQTVAEGSNATLSTVAEGTSTLSYQWNFDGTAIPGATNSIITITNVQSANTGLYSVTVVNAYGSVTSTNAILNISALGPSITEQPTNDAVVLGGTAMFSVTVTGTLPLNYFWSFKGANIPGATNSTLILTNVIPAQAGPYSVFILNNYGSTNSATATLTVINNQPRLATAFSSRTLYISWPTNAAGFVLVTTTNLLSTNWVPVATSPVRSGSQYVVPVVPSGSKAFFRLKFSGI